MAVETSASISALNEIYRQVYSPDTIEARIKSWSDMISYRPYYGWVWDNEPMIASKTDVDAFKTPAPIYNEDGEYGP